MPIPTANPAHRHPHPAPRPLRDCLPPARRDHGEREFGVGYGRSSGYAGGKQYARSWTGAARFRCG